MKRRIATAVSVAALGLMAIGGLAQARELEPGDDRGGHHEIERGDDRGGAQVGVDRHGEPEPGDDRGGRRHHGRGADDPKPHF
jgi:hypothetical protein